MPLPLQSPAPISLSRWQESSEHHRQEVEQITIPMRARKSRGEKHPVYDFLHTYYSFPLGRLEKWHPGFAVPIEINQTIDLPEKYYHQEGGIAWIDSEKLTLKSKERLLRIHRLLTLTQSRPP
jgi:hypothetical protein